MMKKVSLFFLFIFTSIMFMSFDKGELVEIKNDCIVGTTLEMYKIYENHSVSEQGLVDEMLKTGKLKPIKGGMPVRIVQKVSPNYYEVTVGSSNRVWISGNYLKKIK